MLPKEVHVDFKFNPRIIFVSPLFVFLIIILWFLPWGSNNAPAWVQAVGSVLAIVAAWLIPYLHEIRNEIKRRDDLYHSVGWLAYQSLNSFDFMIEVIDRGEDPMLEHWRFTGALSGWRVHADMVNKLPIDGFTGGAVAYLVSLKQAVNFGLECAQELDNYQFQQFHVGQDFPLRERCVFHRAQIDWVVEDLLGERLPKAT